MTRAASRSVIESLKVVVDLLSKGSCLRGTDPGGFYPDPTFEKKLDSDLDTTFKKTGSDLRKTPDPTLKKLDPDPTLFLPKKVGLLLFSFDIKINRLCIITL